MKKLMKGYEQAKKIRRREGEPFNHRPINTALKRKQRRGLVFDKRRRLWVKRGGAVVMARKKAFETGLVYDRPALPTDADVREMLHRPYPTLESSDGMGQHRNAGMLAAVLGTLAQVERIEAAPYVFPLVIDVANWENMVDAELAHQDAETMHAVLSGVFETGLVYDQPQARVCPPMDSSMVSYTGRIDAGAAHRAVSIARQLVQVGVWNGKDAIAIHNPYDLENKLMRLEWDGKNAAALVAGVDYDIYTKPSFETGLVYGQPEPYKPEIGDTGLVCDQPQPFTFDFKRGDVVEFLFAFPRTPAHKGWLKGVFYNVYPGDSRYACIRREGIYEAARLADIRKPLPVVVDIFDGMGDFDVKASDSAKAA